MMKHLILGAVLALSVACGGKQHTSAGDDELSSGDSGGTGPVKDTRTEIERRRDAACDTLGPRITACAVEDAKRDLAAGKTTKAQYEKDTASMIRDKNTAEFIKACKGHDYSSRQIRVLEICPKAETDCDKMLSCLDNLNTK